MEVPKSISPNKTLRPFFSRKPPAGTRAQVLARVHAIQLFFGIVSPHGNVDSTDFISSENDDLLSMTDTTFF